MRISSATWCDQKLTTALAILPDVSSSKLTMAGDASDHRGRVHHLLQEEPERSEIVFREDFTGDMVRVFALAAELLQIAVRVTDSRANLPVWLIRSKMQHQRRADMSILARVPVTMES